MFKFRWATPHGKESFAEVAQAFPKVRPSVMKCSEKGEETLEPVVAARKGCPRTQARVGKP